MSFLLSFTTTILIWLTPVLVDVNVNRSSFGFRTVEYRRHNKKELIVVHSRKRVIGFVAKTLPFEKLTNTPFATTVVMLLFMTTLTLMHRSFESKILREELERVSSIAAKNMGRPLSHLPPLLNQMHLN
ncbi:hypothetical protein Bca101_089541 [Brassica carinata]